MDVPPQKTIYVQNLYEELSKEVRRDAPLGSNWDGDWASVMAHHGSSSVAMGWCGPVSCLEGLFSACVEQYVTIIMVARSLLLRTESIFVLIVSLASPCFFYYYHLPDGDMMAYGMNWTLVATLLVFPLTMTLTSVFARREAALVQLSILKASLIAIFVGHKDWGWYTIPRNPSEAVTAERERRLHPQHAEKVLEEMKGLIVALRGFLTAPMASRLRHYYTSAGHKERTTILEVSQMISERIMHHLHALSLLCEEFKAAGLPANEATRIRQYFLAAVTALMQLRFLKQYRTPMGLRAFSRFFILIMPIMMGPYYSDLADSTHIAFAISFSVATSMALQGLFHLRFELEDPFESTRVCHDAVDVHRELDELQADLDTLHGETTSYPPFRVDPFIPPSPP